MSHLDEGTLHALLDGELETNEVAEIQAHLGSCSACGLRLREVKEFLAEADRLIASVDLEATSALAAPRPTPIGAAPSASRTESEMRHDTPSRPQPPVQPAVKWEPWNEPPPPVLLIPDNESAAERRMRRMRRLGWAAIVLVIAGAGWVEARKMLPVNLSDAEPTPKTQAVVSPEETSRPDQAALSSALAKADSSAPAPILARKPAPASRPSAAPQAGAGAGTTAPSRQENAKTLTPREEPPREVEAKDTPTPAATEQLADGRAQEDTAMLNESSIDKLADSGTEKAAADSAATEDLATVRERASQALAELDRERRRKQAAAATAALDAQRRRSAAAQPTAAAPARGAVQPAAAPPPAPPTLEQRAQIYLRIGLDEASRQLGGPAHVIEGLSPLFMGLAQGVVVAGADGTRPVVRVVYQDSQGRLILLDQQRLRAGQAAPPASQLSWTIGGTVMWLNGEASPEILRTYRPRVR